MGHVVLGTPQFGFQKNREMTSNGDKQGMLGIGEDLAKNSPSHEEVVCDVLQHGTWAHSRTPSKATQGTPHNSFSTNGYSCWIVFILRVAPLEVRAACDAFHLAKAGSLTARLIHSGCQKKTGQHPQPLLFGQCLGLLDMGETAVVEGHSGLVDVDPAPPWAPVDPTATSDATFILG